MAKLYIKNTDGTYSPYNPVAVSNLDIVQETGNSLTSAMSQKAVTDELTKKQDTINDIADIRSNAAKGATALQSETDPVYLADKPNIALKTEIPDVSGKADLHHQHTVADITNFPELYYDATAFFASGAYPNDKYEELLEAVKAKKTVYATIDEQGYISYVFFMSSANSDGSSSRVLLTTIFADGGNLYLNTFVLQQSGMTPLQESITGKAAKATTLAGYNIGDAYTKSEVDAAIATAITTTLNTEV